MIEFNHPSALWLLLLIVPIVLLYLLKHKRREVEVPSILLWKQAVEDMRAQTPFQKLKSNLLLLLQILAIVLAGAVLSEPYLPQGSGQEQKWIFVLDTSAGMLARDENPDRFGIAKERLLQIVNSLSASSEILLISTAAQSSVVQPYTANIPLVRRKISALKPVSLGSNWKQLSALLEPLIKEKPRPKIVIASDFANFSETFAKQIPFEPVRVGKESGNVGITRAAMQPLPEEPGKQAFFYQLENFSMKQKSIDVEIFAGNTLIDAYQAELGPGAADARTMEMTVTRPLKIAVRLKTGDVFPLDDDFVWSATPASPVRVSSRIQDPYLLKALNVLPGVTLDKAGPIHIASLVGPQPGIYFLAAAQTDSPGEVIKWNNIHPALRFVDAGLWKFTHCSVLQVPSDATVLLESRKGPIAYATVYPVRKIVFGFSLTDSNLPLLAAFPVFLQNSIDWIRAGEEPIRPSVTSEAHESEGPITSSPDAPFVNFLDRSESNIHPEFPSGNSNSEIGNLLRRQDLSAWFLILLGAVVIVEWWVFHQRIHVEA